MFGQRLEKDIQNRKNQNLRLVSGKGIDDTMYEEISGPFT